jgi:hypothetical protein
LLIIRLRLVLFRIQEEDRGTTGDPVEASAFQISEEDIWVTNNLVETGIFQNSEEDIYQWITDDPVEAGFSSL